MLRNHGARIVYSSTRHGQVVRFVRPNGTLSSFEAARLLGTYRNMLIRMAAAGRLKIRSRAGKSAVPLSEVRRLLALPTDQRTTADRGPA
jgi:hypothetical protein